MPSKTLDDQPDEVIAIVADIRRARGRILFRGGMLIVEAPQSSVAVAPIDLQERAERNLDALLAYLGID